jgi:hypothetical protein
MDSYRLPSSTSFDDRSLERIAALLRIELDPAFQLMGQVIEWADFDDERYLDLLHHTLPNVLDPWNMNDWQHLESLLRYGGSVWRATKYGLERRVDPTATGAFDQATRISDAVSDELVEGWSNAYGRNPDASDAWDHAIKAVEAILRGIVSPNNTQATLGSIIRDLRNGAHKFDFVLTNDLGGVDTFLAMLQLMWPNPDRHGDLQQRRIPSPDEARAVVHLAITIVQWARDGQIVRR